MAAGAEQIEQKIIGLARAITELISQSRTGADAVKSLEESLGRLASIETSKLFSSSDMATFVQMLNLVGKSAGTAKRDIDKIADAAYDLREAFQNFEVKLVGAEDLEARLLRAARKAGVAKEGIALLRKELRALEQKGGTQTQTVQLLNRIKGEAEITKETLTTLIAVARRWRTELEKGQKAAAEGMMGRKGDRTDLGLESGPEVEEESIGQLIKQSKELYGSVLPGGIRALNNVEEALDGARLSLDDLTDVTDDSARGIVRWTASMQTKDGITRRAVITTNRFGQVLKSTQRHLRTFAGGIARDITEVMKWSIAIAIVYAPMRKMTDLMQETIQIEAKLADVQVALGGSSANLAAVWENTTIIARELGVSVEGVVDGYVLAARATANISDPADKAAATTAVLRDSMLLAKLAGIDQAIALDTLVGALRQLNRPLTTGTELVDKWVAVSKAANVSLHTLAESFAITATAARNVGIDMDHLNGIIAAVAEVTTLSATESGNAVRAFISGFQSDQSEKALAKFGIAVKNVNGELRSFTDVMESIIERKDLGLISDQEMAKISEIIGGGARRGAQVNAFLENYSRVQELAAISSNATGDAADALSIKLDTLQTAAQNLDNAFSELARSLGTDGGFLDLARGGIKVLTGMVDILNKVVKMLGTATPAVIAFGIAWKVLKKNMMVQTFLDTSIMGAVSGPAEGTFSKQREGISTLLEKIGMQSTTSYRTAVQPLMKKGTLGGAIGGGLIGAGTAALAGDFGRGEEGYYEAGAQIVGGMLGSFIGGPAGAAIGSAIAQYFVGEVKVSMDDLRRVMSLTASGGFAASTTVSTLAENPEELENRVNDLIQQASAEGKGAGYPRWINDMFSEKAMKMVAVPAFRKTIEEALGAAEGAISDSDIATALQEELLRVLAGEERRYGEPGGVAMDIIQQAMDVSAANPEIRAAAKLLLEASQEGVESESVDLNKAFGLRLLGVSEEFGPIAANILSQQRQTLLQDVAKGEVGVRALQEFLNIGAFEQVTSTIVSALGEGEASAESYRKVAEILIGSTEQERQIFGQLAGEIETLTNEYDELSKASGGYTDYSTRMELQKLADALHLTTEEMKEYLRVSEMGQAYKDFVVPQIIEVKEGTTQRELMAAMQDTRTIQQAQADAISLDPNLQAKATEGWTDVMFQIGDITDTNWTQIFENLDPTILANKLEEAGLLAQQAAMQFMQIDIPASEVPQWLGNIEYYRKLLEPTGYLDTQELENIMYLTSDDQVGEIRTQGILAQLAMQDLIAINEQQLEGIFNIPEGVTAQIPFTGKLYFSDQPIPTAGSGGGIVAKGPPVDELSTAKIVEAIDVGLAEINARYGIDPETITEEMELEDYKAPPLTMTEIMEAIALQDLQYAESPELKQADAHKASIVDDIKTLLTTDYYANPELKQHHRFTGLSTEDVLAALPQSIPVTINTRIVNPISVFVDSFLVQQALEERQFDDLQEATRRTGAVGYIME